MELLDASDLPLPAEYKQLPDTFITGEFQLLYYFVKKNALLLLLLLFHCYYYLILLLHCNILHCTTPVQHYKQKRLIVYKGSDTSHHSVAFARLKTSDFLPKEGVRAETRWIDLDHDMSHRSTPQIGFPGSVLLKMALVNSEDVEELESWEGDRRKLEVKYENKLGHE